MSARLSIATPHRPTSPSDIGSSESIPNSVGMSNAVDSPSPPALMISLNRQFVSSAVPNPANMRIVHNFDRYIDAYGPRVNGYTPGNSPSSGPYTGSSGTPDIVVYSRSRSDDVSNARCHSSRGLTVIGRSYGHRAVSGRSGWWQHRYPTAAGRLRVSSVGAVHSGPRHDDHEVARGIRAGLVAYTVWGLLTIYWKQLSDFEPFELIGWRIATSGLVMAGVLTVGRRWSAMRTAFGNRRLLARITAAALLLTVNWTAYVYAVVHDRIIETALGYFMAPLGTMMVGIVVLGERPTVAQKWAVALAAVSVVELTVSYGRPPYTALVIAVTWTLYGLLKRQVPLSAVEGLAAETFVLLVPALVAIGVMAGRSASIPRTADAGQLALVSLAGVATVVPLTLFAFAASRVPFTILGPLNDLVPTINFLLGWIIYDEDLPYSRLVGFAFVWVALAMITVDRLRTTVVERRDVARMRAATPD